VAQLHQQVVATKAAHASAAERLAAKRARLKECDQEIKALEKERAKLVKKQQEMELDKKKLENR
jgi:hypothetical protein